jgi:branched-chain amino acid transport system substrate-binding protein
MNALRFITASVAVTAIAVGLAATPANAEGVKLGQLTSLTGTNAVQGQDMQRGMELAVKRVNEGYEVPLKDGSSVTIGPGLLDGDVKVIVEDTESRPASAMDAVRKLVNVDNVPVVVGEYSSGISVPTGQFTNTNQVIQISVGSTSPKLRDIGPYFFNAIGLDNLMGAALARFAVEDSGAKRFASITPNNPFGVGIEINACKTLKKEFSGECVSTVRYELEKSDYRAEIKQVFAPEPEAGFYTAYGTESRLIFRQMHEMGMELPEGWYADYMTMWSNEVKDIPQVAEGVKGLIVGVSGDFYRNEYADAYEKAYGEAPTTTFGGYAYDAAMMAMLAIHEAGSSELDKVAEAMHKVSQTYKGVTGDKAVDEDGMQKNENYQRMIYKNGELEPYSVSGSAS